MLIAEHTDILQRQQTAIVTGASGFLGRYVARLLAAKGFHVVGVGHGCWPEAERHAWGVQVWHEGDVTLETLNRLQIQPAMLFHCAGSGSVGLANAEPLTDFYRTVVPTAHVLEYLRTRAPGCTLVYPSSAGVYGEVDTVPILENSPVAPISKYGEHKAMAESTVRFSARQYGLRAAVVRLFSVYGPGQRKQLLWDACRKISTGDPVFGGTGLEVRDWIHAEDAASLLLEAARHASPECPVINGGSGEGIQVRSIVEHVAHQLAGNTQVVRFSGEGRPGDPDRFVADMSTAHGWGWMPHYDWRTGIAAYVAWWQTEGQKS